MLPLLFLEESSEGVQQFHRRAVEGRKRTFRVRETFGKEESGLSGSAKLSGGKKVDFPGPRNFREGRKWTFRVRETFGREESELSDFFGGKVKGGILLYLLSPQPTASSRTCPGIPPTGGQARCRWLWGGVRRASERRSDALRRRAPCGCSTSTPSLLLRSTLQ